MMKRIAICVLASAACSSSARPVTGPRDGGQVGVTYRPETGPPPDASSSADATVDAGAGASPRDGGEADGGDSGPRAHVRFANWTPDAPAAGFSYCLAPQGTSAWMGPFQTQGLSFPSTGAYADVPPGDYQVQVIPAQSGDCTSGVNPATKGLPNLADGTYATIATLGNMMPSGGDADMKVAAFLDDVSAPSATGLKLRAINAASRIGYAEVGTGSQAAGDFSVMFPVVPFGTVATMTADGGAIDPNGYALFAPLSGVQLSAYPITGDSTASAAASQVSIAAGITATLVIVGGEDNGPPPQFMICNDLAAAGGSASACTVYGQ